MNETDPRLARLLRLKASERPHDVFLEGVASEFHRRLRAEQRRSQVNPLGAALSRFLDALTINPLPALRWFGASFGTVTACCVALAVLRPFALPVATAPSTATPAAPAIAAVTPPAAAVETELVPPDLSAESPVTVASLADDSFDQGVFMQAPAWSGRDLRLQPAAPGRSSEVIPVAYDEAGVPF